MKSHERSRRGFLRLGMGGLAGLSLAEALERTALASPAEAATRAKNVIMIFLTGGPATIDMWDMKPDAPKEIRGDFQPAATSASGVQICDLMPKLSAAMHYVTLVRSVTHTIAEHTQGTTYVMTGNRPTPAFEYPSLGALSASLAGNSGSTPAYMTIGDPPAAGAGELGAGQNPFEVALGGPQGAEKKRDSIGLPEGFTKEDLERRQLVLERLDRKMQGSLSETPLQLERFQRQAFEILRSDKINQALDLERESAKTREVYGGSAFGKSALSARRLIEAGVRFVTIGFGDWDTHANNFARLRTRLLPELDRGLAALLSDLASRGMLEETIIYCAGEFGRTPAVNGAAGRDHWARSMTSLVAGGGFRGGFVYGATDKQGTEPIEHPCSPDDVSATIFHQLGFAPSLQVSTRSGRPVPLFRNGGIIKELVA